MTVIEKAIQTGIMMTTERVGFGFDGAAETGGGNEAIVDIEVETSSSSAFIDVSGTDSNLSSGWGGRDILVGLEDENQGCGQSRRIALTASKWE
jgi:predicted porin